MNEDEFEPATSNQLNQARSLAFDSISPAENSGPFQQASEPFKIDDESDSDEEQKEAPQQKRRLSDAAAFNTTTNQQSAFDSSPQSSQASTDNSTPSETPNSITDQQDTNKQSQNQATDQMTDEQKSEALIQQLLAADQLAQEEAQRQNEYDQEEEIDLEDQNLVAQQMQYESELAALQNYQAQQRQRQQSNQAPITQSQAVNSESRQQLPRIAQVDQSQVQTQNNNKKKQSANQPADQKAPEQTKNANGYTSWMKKIGTNMATTQRQWQKQFDSLVSKIDGKQFNSQQQASQPDKDAQISSQAGIVPKISQGLTEQQVGRSQTNQQNGNAQRDQNSNINEAVDADLAAAIAASLAEQDQSDSQNNQQPNSEQLKLDAFQAQSNSKGEETEFEDFIFQIDDSMAKKHAALFQPSINIHSNNKMFFDALDYGVGEQRAQMQFESEDPYAAQFNDQSEYNLESPEVFEPVELSQQTQSNVQQIQNANNTEKASNIYDQFDSKQPPKKKAPNQFWQKQAQLWTKPLKNIKF